MDNEKKRIRVIAIFILMLIPFVKLILAGLWAAKGNLIYAGVFAFASIIWAIIASAILVSFVIRLSAEDFKGSLGGKHWSRPLRT